MLIEHRAYTARPGHLKAFFEAQIERGFPLVQPILDRLVGFFSTTAGPDDQIVHLYRFDSYEDWVKRLHGLYGVAALQPYFAKVRPMMLAQANKFLVPAPVAALTPYLGNGNDWLPGQRTVGRASPEWLVDESTATLFPGGLPKYWEAARDPALGTGSVATEHLFGVFYSLVGQQHEVVTYRYYPSFAAREAHRESLARNTAYQSFMRTVSALAAKSETKLLRPAPIAQMSPLFAF